MAEVKGRQPVADKRRKPQGDKAQAADKMLQERLATLAADVASLYDIPVAEVVEKLRATIMSIRSSL